MEDSTEGDVHDDVVENLSPTNAAKVKAMLRGRHIITNYDAPWMHWNHTKSVSLDGTLTLEDLKLLVEVMEYLK